MGFYCQPCLGQPEAGGGGALVAQPALQALPLSDDAVSQLTLAQPARVQALHQRVQVCTRAILVNNCTVADP